MNKDPEVGELVLGRVKEVRDYGAYVDVEEYPGYEGFVHVSEVSLKWVRNIREHLKEGQRKVFKIIRVNPQTLQADLSIRRVSQKERVEKLLEVKKKSKTKKVLKALEDKNLKRLVEIISASIPDPVQLYQVFEGIAGGEEVSKFFPALNVSEAEQLRKAVEQEIKVRELETKAEIILRCENRDGAKAIREAAEAAEKAAGPGEKLEIRTKGAPVYGLFVKTSSRERAEEVIREAFKICDEVMKKYGGVAELKQAAK